MIGLLSFSCYRFDLALLDIRSKFVDCKVYNVKSSFSDFTNFAKVYIAELIEFAVFFAAWSRIHCIRYAVYSGYRTR